MLSVFEELLALDRPYLPLSLKFGSSERKFTIRKLNAADADALEAFFSDEYARLVIEKTEPEAGLLSELERVRQTYALRPRHDLVEQVVGTRFLDVQKRALELGGEELREFASMELPFEEQQAHEAEVKSRLLALDAQARVEISEEYATKADEELVDLMAQVNINMKSISEARSRQNARNLYYVLYTEDSKERVFPNHEAVLQLTQDLIENLLQSISLAFSEAALKDLPFDLPVAPERDKPLPSPSTLEAATKTSGKRTRTRPSDSK